MIDRESRIHKEVYTLISYAIVIVGMLLLISGVCILLVELLR